MARAVACPSSTLLRSAAPCRTALRLALHRACVGALLCLLGAGVVRAGEVIAHPSVHLDARQVRDVFLGEKVLVGHMKLVPVDNLGEQELFLSRVLQTDQRKYAARWIRKTFREGLNAPPLKGSDAEVIAFVRSTVGAVGYVPELSEAEAEAVKVLEHY